MYSVYTLYDRDDDDDDRFFFAMYCEIPEKKKRKLGYHPFLSTHISIYKLSSIFKIFLGFIFIMG
mgnify:CR=1 FL=1